MLYQGRRSALGRQPKLRLCRAFDFLFLRKYPEGPAEEERLYARFYSL